MTAGARPLRAATLVALVACAAGPVQAQETGSTHEVRVGDTLWDLAGRYLADPFRWPEIFDLNPDVVEDPHWIFPGERLRIPGSLGERAVPARTARRDRAPAARARPGARAGARNPSGEFPESSIFRQGRRTSSLGGLSIADTTVLPIVSRSDFYGAPILIDRSAVPVQGRTARIAEENPLDLKLAPGVQLHDLVVLALSGLGVVEGEILQGVRWGRSIMGHGSVLEPMSLLEVTRVSGDSARAEVIALFADYKVGDPVIPASPYSLAAELRAEPVPSGFVAEIVDFAVPQRLVGPGELMFIDAGASAGVQIGDEFATFSGGEPFPGSASLEDLLCTLRVVRVTDRTATAMVIGVRDPGTRPGFPARLVAQMPRGVGG